MDELLDGEDKLSASRNEQSIGLPMSRVGESKKKHDPGLKDHAFSNPQ